MLFTFRLCWHSTLRRSLWYAFVMAACTSQSGKVSTSITISISIFIYISIFIPISIFISIFYLYHSLCHPFWILPFNFRFPLNISLLVRLSSFLIDFFLAKKPVSKLSSLFVSLSLLLFLIYLILSFFLFVYPTVPIVLLRCLFPFFCFDFLFPSFYSLSLSPSLFYYIFVLFPLAVSLFLYFSYPTTIFYSMPLLISFLSLLHPFIRFYL